MDNSDRLESVKRTRMGVIILGISVLLMTVAYLLPPISVIACLAQLIGLVATIGPIVGLVLIARGANAFSRGHVFLARVSLVFILISIFLVFIILIGSIVVNIVSVAGMDFEEGVLGSDLKDLFRIQVYLIWIGFIPSFLMMGAYMIGLWGISPRWGKVVLWIFIAGTLGSMIGGGFITQDQIEGEIEEIESGREYETEDYTDISTEMAIKIYTAGMMRLTYLGLLIIASVSSLLYVNGKIKETYISG
jgi:hypothetical protein